MCISLLGSLRSQIVVSKIMAVRQSSDMIKFKEALQSAKNVVFLSGAGISAESGIPTFRGAGGYWRKYQASSLATPGAFKNSPSLVWEFYHYRREVAAKAQPNRGHIAIANYEEKHGSNKSITVITQNVDNLHARAGTKNLLELHGNLYKTRCTKCKEVLENTDSPICEATMANMVLVKHNSLMNVCGYQTPRHQPPYAVACRRIQCLSSGESHLFTSVLKMLLVLPRKRSRNDAALANKGAPDMDVVGSNIPVKSLPHCKKSNCNGLLRPHIVWFGENLEHEVLKKAEDVMATCDVCLVVGTSSVVYPAAMFAPQAAARGAIVAEFNLEPTPATPDFHYYFEGPCGTTLPLALDH